MVAALQQPQELFPVPCPVVSQIIKMLRVHEHEGHGMHTAAEQKHWKAGREGAPTVTMIAYQEEPTAKRGETPPSPPPITPFCDAGRESLRQSA